MSKNSIIINWVENKYYNRQDISAALREPPCQLNGMILTTLLKIAAEDYFQSLLQNRLKAMVYVCLSQRALLKLIVERCNN
jgi:hypothetical protein